MKFWKLILILVALISLAVSQEILMDAEPELGEVVEPIDSLRILFDEGVQCYNDEHYWDALKIFEQLNAIPMPENHLLSASGLMLLKTCLRLGDPDRAIQLGPEFILIHKASKYLDDVKYALGEAYLISGSYNDAIYQYLEVMRISDEERLRYLSKQTVETIIDLFISSEELMVFRENSQEDFHRLFLSLKLAEKYHAEGDNKQAEKELRSGRDIIKDPYFNREYIITLEKLRKRARENIYIGIILPLSGPMANIGLDLLNGMRYALNQFRANYDKEIAAIVMDNRGEVVESIRKAEYLCNNPKVKAIIGPVSSENTIAVAAVANQRKVPIITPTATNSEISSLGPFVFQANVDYDNLGQFLGKYCTDVSKVNTIATLSPADKFGKEMTDAFCRSVDNAGGRIVSQQWYRGEPEELKRQFSVIRESGLLIAREMLDQKIAKNKERLLQYAASDSLWQTDSIFVDIYADKYRIFTADSEYVVDLNEALILTKLMDFTEFLIPKKDSLEFRINSIDGLLVPAYASDLKMLIPQLEYYNLDAKIYGSGNWNEPTLLKKHPKIARNLTFISDFYIDEDSRFYKNFERYYSRLIGSKPNRFDLYGYDTMRALLSVFDEGDCGRETIREKLAQMPTYNGICRNISFRGNRPRVNSCAFILTMTGGKIKPVAATENGDIISFSPQY
ncbi:MAG TPA: hypothetical protein DHW42_09765 [Candidatus Marinimicrobia bacterium]|nr:hypothetical protein [Candidatus Neomarinimicrobiota bacterium]